MVERVGIETFVDPRKSEDGARRTNRALGSMEQGALRAERSMSGIGSAAKRAGAAVVAALSVHKVVQYADAWTSVTNQLRIVTDGTAQLATATDLVFQAAQKTRAPIGALVTLYSRAALSADKLNATQTQLASFTENVGKALAVQGSNANESRGALIQLSQAIGSGIVRAEEYNAVLEGARPILIAVSKGLKEAGGDVAVLRNLVTSGKVSSEAFFKAFLIGSKDLEEQHKTTTATVAQSFTQLENSTIRFIGQLNEANGASAVFGGAIDRVRQTIDDLDAQLLSSKFGIYIKQWEFALEDVVTQLGVFENEIQLTTDIAGASASFIGDAFANMPNNLVAAIRIAVVEAAAFLDRSQAKVEIFAAKTKQALTDIATLGIGDVDVSSADIASANRAINASDQARLATITEILDKHGEQKTLYDQQIAAAEALAAVRKKDREAERASTETERQKELEKLRSGGPVSINDFPTSAAGGADGKESPAQKAQARLQSQAESANEALERQIALFNDTSNAGAAAYDTVSGKLEGINPQLAERIRLNAQTLDQLQKQGDMQQQLAALEDELLTPAERINQIYAQRLDLIRNAGLEEARSVELTAKVVAEKEEELRKLKEQEVVGFDAIFGKGSLENLFSDFNNIEANFKGLVIRMIAEATQAQILQALGVSSGGKSSFSDIAGSFVGSFFGAGKANGGRFGPGEMFPVNERGPELATIGNQQYLMTNGARGNITPNEQISQSTTRIINAPVTVIASEPSRFKKAERQITVDMKRRLA